VKPAGAAPERTRILKREKKPKRPSYVSPRNFALALTQTLKQAGGVAVEDLKYGTAAAHQIKKGFESIDPTLREQLEPLWHEADRDLDKFRRGVEKWFDDGMDRVSGWYRRWSQCVTIVIAVVVAIGLNASALRITERLYDDESVRSAVVSSAEGTAAGDAPNAGEGPEQAGEQAQKALGELSTLGLPIFWGERNDPFTSVEGGLESALGWLITAIAISLGAPFWFGALGKVSRLRTSGAKPEAAPARQEPPATVRVVAAAPEEKAAPEQEQPREPRREDPPA
jgi:hypothetical protein